MTKTLLNLFVIYHLTVVVFAPNINTYIGGWIAPIIAPYAGFLGLGSTWSFFAPDPGPPPIFLEWEYLGSQNSIIGTGQLPEAKDRYWLVERQNRRYVLGRSLFNFNDRYVTVFGHYLCRTHSEIEGVRLWKAAYTIPGIQEIRDGKRKVGDDIGSVRTSVGVHFCERDGRS